MVIVVMVVMVVVVGYSCSSGSCASQILIDVTGVLEASHGTNLELAGRRCDYDSCSQTA